MAQLINYTPPDTISRFIKDHLPGELFNDWIVGPVGSGKTTGIFMKLITMAGLQAKGPDGIRRSRAVIVRNTNQQLIDTTLNSWFTWFKPGQAGLWEITPKRFTLRYADVECEVLFRALDTVQDVQRVLSLEVTFALIDEFVEIPQAIIEALSARCGRYPSVVAGGCTNWGMWGSSNPSTEDNWWFDYLHNSDGVIQAGEGVSLFHRQPTDQRNSRYFIQPSGFSPFAENVENLPGERGYYTNLAKNRSEAWIKQFIDAEWGYSVAGKPVVQSFNAKIHVSKTRLRFDPNLHLVGGYDPGLGGSAMVFGQEDLEGRLHVLGEIITSGVGAGRFINERLRPYLARQFPDLRPDGFTIAPDPAANNRSAAGEPSALGDGALDGGATGQRRFREHGVDSSNQVGAVARQGGLFRGARRDAGEHVALERGHGGHQAGPPPRLPRLSCACCAPGTRSATRCSTPVALTARRRTSSATASLFSSGSSDLRARSGSRCGTSMRGLERRVKRSR